MPDTKERPGPIGPGLDFGLFPLRHWRSRPPRREGRRIQQQQGVGGHAEDGGVFDRAGIADLRLAHSEQSFFFAEINFDVPAPDISLDDDLRVEVFLGAQEEGGLTIKQLGALAQTIGERGDDDQLRDLMSAGGTPHQADAAIVAQLMRDAVVQEGQRLPGRGVGTDLLGGRSGRFIAEAATARLLGGRIGAKEQMGVLAEAADGGSVGGRCLRTAPLV